MSISKGIRVNAIALDVTLTDMTNGGKLDKSTDFGTVGAAGR